MTNTEETKAGRREWIGLAVLGKEIRMAELKPLDETNLDGYGAPIIPWKVAHTLLEETWMQAVPGDGAGTHWLATTRKDGRPHNVPVGAVWVEDAFYFTSGAGTRKSRDLADDPRCVISLSGKGLDVVVDGVATRVTDAATLERLAKVYSDNGWPCTVEDGAFTAEFSAPSAGPAPWDLYQVTPSTIFGSGNAEPYGATRWTFKRPR